MNENKPGWDGETIPLELQALVFMKKYRLAVAVVAANATRLHHQVEGLLSPLEDGDSIVAALGEDPFFMKLLLKLQESHDKFGDKSFRRGSNEVFAEAGEELEDMIAWLAIALWIDDGASFPEGIMDEDSYEDEEE